MHFRKKSKVEENKVKYPTLTVFLQPNGRGNVGAKVEWPTDGGFFVEDFIKMLAYVGNGRLDVEGMKKLVGMYVDKTGDNKHGVEIIQGLDQIESEVRQSRLAEEKVGGDDDESKPLIPADSVSKYHILQSKSDGD